MRNQKNTFRIKSTFMVFTILFSFLIILGCRRSTNTDSLKEIEVEGKLKIVLVDSQNGYESLFYVLSNSEAYFLDFTKDTKFVGLDNVAEGDGYRLGDWLLHSNSQYKVHGKISDDDIDKYGLVSLKTSKITPDIFECIEKGSGTCSIYVGRYHPPKPDAYGFVDDFPEELKGKTGVFVKNGSGTCSIKSTIIEGENNNEPYLINNLKISVQNNTQAPWAVGRHQE